MKEVLGKTVAQTGKAKRLGTNFGAILFIVILLLVIVKVNSNSQDTIQIVQVKEDVYPDKIITEDMIQSYGMVREEFDNSGGTYLLWENREEAIDKYSTVFVKGGRYIESGEYRDSKPLKNPWLSLNEDNKDSVYVTLPYNKSEAFGNILTPGDSLKVNVTYTIDETTNSQYFNGVSSKEKSETLFERITVTDLLNGSGNSIYDYYMDLLNLPLAEREALLRDESFLSNVSPVSMTLKVDKNSEFQKYSEMRKLSGVTYTFGLYPREEGDIIIEQFQDITRMISKSQVDSQQAQVQGGE